MSVMCSSCLDPSRTARSHPLDTLGKDGSQMRLDTYVAPSFLNGRVRTTSCMPPLNLDLDLVFYIIPPGPPVVIPCFSCRTSIATNPLLAALEAITTSLHLSLFLTISIDALSPLTASCFTFLPPPGHSLHPSPHLLPEHGILPSSLPIKWPQTHT
jgi:hypothetical protein